MRDNVDRDEQKEKGKVTKLNIMKLMILPSKKK